MRDERTKTISQILQEEHKIYLGDRLGRGGFAEVYEAKSAEGVACAVKISLDPIDEQNEAVRRELENLQLVQKVTGHPRVVTLMDYWVIEGYLVTRWELAQEGTLLDKLKEYQRHGNQGIPPETLLPWMGQAAEGIDFLNSKRIYHRDIKPQNLLLFHGQVKLGDLGLAKFVGASTVKPTVAGTVGYMPPEISQQRKLSHTVDLYSLAATYVKLRTGQEPFGEDPVSAVLNQSAGNVRLDGLPGPEAELLRRALSPDPDQRPQNGCQRFIAELHQVVLQQVPVQAGPVSANPGSDGAVTAELGQNKEPVGPPHPGFGKQPTWGMADPGGDTAPFPGQVVEHETEEGSLDVIGAIRAILRDFWDAMRDAIQTGVWRAVGFALVGAIAGGIGLPVFEQPSAAGKDEPSAVAAGVFWGVIAGLVLASRKHACKCTIGAPVFAILAGLGVGLEKGFWAGVSGVLGGAVVGVVLCMVGSTLKRLFWGEN